MGRRGAKARLAEIAALSQADDAVAVPALTKAASDEDGEICRAGLIALADRGAVGPVAEVALRDPRPGARAVAAELLTESPTAATAVVERYLQPGGSLTGDAEAVVLRILAAAPDDGRRGAAAMAVASVGEGTRQVPAVRLLGALRDSSATPALVELLHGGAVPARAAAATALGRIKDPRAAQSLVSATSDDAAEVSAAAREALAGMGRAATFAYAANTNVEADEARDLSASIGALLESVPAATTARAEVPAPVAEPEPEPPELVAEPEPEPTAPVWRAPETATEPTPSEVSVPASGASGSGVWTLAAEPAAASAPVAPTAPAGPRPRPERRRRLPVALLAATAGAAVVVMALLLLLGGGDEPAGDRTATQAVPTATAAPDQPSAAEIAAAERAEAKDRRAAEGTHRELVGRSRAAFRREQAELRRRAAAAAAARRAAARLAAAATPAPVRTATPAPVRTTAPVSTPVPPAPTAAPPKPQKTPRPQPTPQVTQPDPVP